MKLNNKHLHSCCPKRGLCTNGLFLMLLMRLFVSAAKEKEPITPFLFRVNRLYTELGVSTVMVIGGSGDFFEVADVVLQFDKYEAFNVTKQAKEIARQFASNSAATVSLQC